MRGDSSNDLGACSKAARGTQWAGTRLGSERQAVGTELVPLEQPGKQARDQTEV